VLIFSKELIFKTKTFLTSSLNPTSSALLIAYYIVELFYIYDVMSLAK